MAAAAKQIQLLARQLFKLSVVDGVVSPDRVAGVLQYIEKSAPAHSVLALKAYRRLIATELAKSEALVEHAGAVTAGRGAEHPPAGAAACNLRAHAVVGQLGALAA